MAKRKYKPVTDDEIITIINMYRDMTSDNKHKYSQADICNKIGRGSSFVYYIIDKYKKHDTAITNRYNKGVLTLKPSDQVSDSEKPSKNVLKTSEKIVIMKPHKLKDAKKPAVGKPIPGKHGGIPHKLNDKYKNLDREELAFLKAAKNSNEFITNFYKRFGFDVKTVSMLNEVWKRREDILKYEEDKLHHAIAKPTKSKIVEPMKERERESMVNEDEILPNLSNKVSELIEIMKDMSKVQDKIVTAMGIS